MLKHLCTSIKRMLSLDDQNKEFLTHPQALDKDNIINQQTVGEPMFSISSQAAKEILAKPEVAEGLKKYQYIMQNFPLVDVVEYAKFQKIYREFYQLRRFYSDEFAKGYFEIMQTLKGVPNVTFQQILEKVNSIEKNSNETSFSSKLLHTLDPSYPIWDSIVTDKHLFNLKAPSSKAENFESQTNEIYQTFKSAFYAYMNSDEGQLLIELFDEKFPNSGISDVKKIDFILWQHRTN